MPIVSKYASFHTAIVGGYTNPSNAFGDNSSYATATPAKNNEVSAYFGFAGFTTAELPADATILRVTVTLEYFVSATNSLPTQGIQVFRGTGGLGSEQTNTTSSTADSLLEHEVLNGISLADLRSNDFVRAMVRSNRGNTNNAVTFNVRYVQVSVEYKTPEDYIRQFSDGVSVSETTSRSRGVFTSLTDAVAASDITFRDKIIEKWLTDNISVSDNSSRQSSFGRAISDGLTISDGSTDLKAFQLGLNDWATPADAQTSQKSISKSFADIVAVSDVPGIFSSNSMSGKIGLLARRIAQEVRSIWNSLDGKADGNHNHHGIYEVPLIFSTGLNRAINTVTVTYGTTPGTSAQGNDPRLSDARTPIDTSVTYAKLAADLTSRNSIAASNIDWSVGGVFTKTITTATTFTFSNLRLNKVITLVMTGNFAITLPMYCKIISGTYDGTANNYIQFHCTNTGSGTEEVWYVISKQAT